MTEPTALPEPTQDTATDAAVPVHPSDILLDFIVAFLAPMFLAASGGDIGFARMAALETVNAYRARDQADLIAIAQIIACGLTALGSLSLSMADNLSLSMTLRLRGNAVALSRVAEHSRRALRQIRRDGAPAPRPRPMDDVTADLPPDQAAYEAEVVAGVAAARTLAAEAQATLRGVTPAAPTHTSPRPVAPAAGSATMHPAADQPGPTQLQWQSMWASAMTEVAGEFTADLKNLPPNARRAASCRAAALSSCANQLLLDQVPPPPEPSGPLPAEASIRSGELARQSSANARWSEVEPTSDVNRPHAIGWRSSAQAQRPGQRPVQALQIPASLQDLQGIVMIAHTQLPRSRQPA